MAGARKDFLSELPVNNEWSNQCYFSKELLLRFGSFRNRMHVPRIQFQATLFDVFVTGGCRAGPKSAK